MMDRVIIESAISMMILIVAMNMKHNMLKTNLILKMNKNKPFKMQNKHWIKNSSYLGDAITPLATIAKKVISFGTSTLLMIAVMKATRLQI